MHSYSSIIRRSCFLIRLVPYLVIVSGCSLSKTQIQQCNTYFKELDDFYTYMNVVNEHSASVKMNRQQLSASSLDSTETIMGLLDTAITHYQDEISMPFELRRSLMELDNYVAGYNFKSSYNTDFLTNFKSFLVEYIPFGVGNIIYQIIYATRKVIIKPNVGRKIRIHVASGNDIIPTGTIIIIDYSGEYIEEFKSEKELLKCSYIHFANGLRNVPDTWENYSVYQPIFIENFMELYISQQMAEHLIAACENLAEAQTVLFENTRKHKKIKKTLPELANFYVEINYLRELEKLISITESK